MPDTRDLRRLFARRKSAEEALNAGDRATPEAYGVQVGIFPNRGTE